MVAERGVGGEEETPKERNKRETAGNNWGNADWGQAENWWGQKFWVGVVLSLLGVLLIFKILSKCCQ